MPKPAKKQPKKALKPYHKDKTLPLSDTSEDDDIIAAPSNPIKEEANVDPPLTLNTSIRSHQEDDRTPPTPTRRRLSFSSATTSERKATPDLFSQDAQRWPSQTKDDPAFVSWEDRASPNPATQNGPSDIHIGGPNCTCELCTQDDDFRELCFNEANCRCTDCIKQAQKKKQESKQDDWIDSTPEKNFLTSDNARDYALPSVTVPRRSLTGRPPHDGSGTCQCEWCKDARKVKGPCTWCTKETKCDWCKGNESQDDSDAVEILDQQEREEPRSLTILGKDINQETLTQLLNTKIAVITDTQTYIRGHLDEIKEDHIILGNVTYDNKPIDTYTIYFAQIEIITPSQSDKKLKEDIRSAKGKIVIVNTFKEENIEGRLHKFIDSGKQAHIILKEVTYIDVIMQMKDTHKVEIADIKNFSLGPQFQDVKTRRRLRTRVKEFLRREEEAANSSSDASMKSVSSSSGLGSGTRSDDQTSCRKSSTLQDLEELQRSSGINPISRPQTSMSEAIHGDKMEDSWEKLRDENFLNIMSDSEDETAAPIRSPSSAEAIKTECDKTKEFISLMKERITALHKNFGLIPDREELMKSIIKTCADVHVGQNDDKVRRIKIPLDYNLKSSSSLAALYRYICTHASDSPRRHWATLTQEGFTDPALFEESKVKWHKSLQSLINSNKMERQITPEVLADLIREAAKANNIKFSKSMTKLTVKEVPEGLPSAKSLNHIWFKLITDPLSKVPLTWNEAMKKAYQRNTYPTRGFYIHGIHEQPQEEDRKTAANVFVDSLATDGAATNVPLGTEKDELDWLTRYHANAKAFRQQVDDRTWKKLQPVYKKWIITYPTEQFSHLVYRLFPHLRDTTIPDTVDANDVSIFNREEPPQTSAEWMRLFATKTVNISGQHLLQAEMNILQCNWRNIIDQNTLLKVAPEDFQLGGRFAHIHIGRQNRLPAEIYRAIAIYPPDIPDLNQIVWRYFYTARVEAAKDYHIEVSQEDLQLSPWLQLLCDDNIPKTFYYDDIDKVQCLSAHKIMNQKTSDWYGPDCLYHNFIRPLERLFTVDMPLNAQLAAALKYKDATDDLGHFVMKLVGWKRFPKKINAVTIVEELSKMRIAHSNQLSCAHQLDPPYQLQRKNELKDSRATRYVNKTHRPQPKDERDFVDANPFRYGSKEEIDKSIESKMQEISGCLQDLEEFNDQLERLRYQLTHVSDPTSRITISQKCEEVGREILATKGHILTSWTHYKLLTDRRWEATYTHIELDEQRLQTLKSDTSHNLRIKLTREQTDRKAQIGQLQQLKKAFNQAMEAKFNRYSKQESDTVLSMLSHIQILDYQIQMSEVTEKAICQILEERVKPTTQISNPSTAWGPHMDPTSQPAEPKVESEAKGLRHIFKKIRPTLKDLSKMYNELNGPGCANLNSTMQESSSEERTRKISTSNQNLLDTPVPPLIQTKQRPATFDYRPRDNIPDLLDLKLSVPRGSRSRPVSRQSAYSSGQKSDHTKGAIPKVRQPTGNGQAVPALNSTNFPALPSKVATQTKQETRYMDQQEDEYIAMHPPGSWAAENPQHKYGEFVEYWPHATNQVIPEWAYRKISAKNLNEKTHHLTLAALQRVVDTQFLTVLALNTGFYYTTIDMVPQVRKDHLPLGVLIKEQTVDRQTGIGYQDAHTVHIPYNFLGGLELTLNMIHERAFPPLKEEKDSLPKTLYKAIEEDKVWRVTTSVLPENSNKVWFRAICFEVTNKTNNMKQRAKIPWIHLSMFKFYFTKTYGTLDSQAYLYDREQGDGACRRLYDNFAIPRSHS